MSTEIHLLLLQSLTYVLIAMIVGVISNAAKLEVLFDNDYIGITKVHFFP